MGSSVLSFDSTAIRTHGPKGGSVISKFGSDRQENISLPHAADILYGNTEGIKNRLKIFHLIRLEKQHILDHFELVSLGKRFRTSSVTPCAQSPVQLTTQWMSTEPGTIALFMPKIGAISIKFSFEEFFDTHSILKDNELMQRSFKLLVKEAGYFAKNADGLPYFLMEISNFPFKEMNKKFALDSLKKLVEESCTNKELHRETEKIASDDSEIFCDKEEISSKIQADLRNPFKPLGRSRVASLGGRQKKLKSTRKT